MDIHDTFRKLTGQDKEFNKLLEKSGEQNKQVQQLILPDPQKAQIANQALEKLFENGQQLQREHIGREISQTENIELIAKILDASLTIATSSHTIALTALAKSESTDRKMLWLMIAGIVVAIIFGILK